MGANQKPELEWILLIHQLPPKPTNLRVRIWRKLQKLGAVAIKNSVYVLPATEQAHEDFQWLKQEIESAGGEASVFRADSVEGATDEEIIAAFRKARDEEFAAISAALDGLTGAIREQSRGKHLSAGRLSAHETEIDKLHAELERIAANDFFDASGKAAAFSAYERCQKAIRAAQGPTRESRSVTDERRNSRRCKVPGSALGDAPQSPHRQAGFCLADQTVHRQTSALLLRC